MDCPHAVGVDVGTVTITGLLQSPIELERIAGNYTFRGPWSGPVSEVGEPVLLRTAGGAHEALEIAAVGVGELDVPEQSIVLEPGHEVALDWVPPAVDAPLCMHVELRISEFRWIECTVEDDGFFVVPADLVTQMFERPASNTHWARLTRTSRGTTSVGDSEVHLEASSQRELPLEIPSLIPCFDGECPRGMECNDGFVCLADSGT